MRHEWICEECGERILFRQPELEQTNHRSEQNEEKDCPECGTQMYFTEEGDDL
jgi:DNA-directed RNA polymerase subunit RPC12/RpoP